MNRLNIAVIFNGRIIDTRRVLVVQLTFGVFATSFIDDIYVLHSSRLHWMHEMQTIVTDVHRVCLSVCLFVSLSCGSTRLHCAGVIWCSLCQITLASCYQLHRVWHDVVVWQTKKRHRRSNSADVAVIAAINEAESRTRRYSTPGLDTTHAESTGDLHDGGLCHWCSLGAQWFRLQHMWSTYFKHRCML